MPFRNKCTSEEENKAKSFEQSSKSFRTQRFKFPKYYKSKSCEQEKYEEDEDLEMPLSSSKSNQQETNIHQHHKLCKSFYTF